MNLLIINMKNMIRSLQGRQELIKLWSTLLLFAVFLTSTISDAFVGTYVGPTPNVSFKHGRVLARSVVLDPETGLPILVEFDTNGDEVREVETGSASVNDLVIVSAADYFFFKQQLEEFQESNAETLAVGAEVLSRNEFSQAQFLSADNQTVLNQGELNEGINSVLVRGQSTRIGINPNSSQAVNDGLVLLQFTFDFTQEITVDEASTTLLVNREGHIVAQSANRIGYRVGFFGDPNEAQNETNVSTNITADDTVFGPIAGVRVNVDEFAYPGGIGATGSDGRYSFQFVMPTCPVGGFTFTTDVWAELRYRNFLPTGSPSISYYLRSPGVDSCIAGIETPFNVGSIGGAIATSSISLQQSNFFVDVVFLNGLISLQNIDGSDVALGDTTYTTFEEPAEQTTQNFYDFNRDGIADHVEEGSIFSCTENDNPLNELNVFFSFNDVQPNTNEVLNNFSCNNGAPIGSEVREIWQGIFFDGKQDGLLDYPDVIRVIDRELRNEPIGLLKTISEADLRNTDVLLFRESTGQLILERRGLKQEEASYRRAVEYNEDSNEVAYRILLRGENDSNANIGGGINRRQSFEDWATDYQLTEPFTQRESDHPRPGEFIKVVAINRATGYIGTARVKLESAGENGTSLVSVETPAITMRPPNLKIWAERQHNIEAGFTQGESKNSTVGNEGAALTSDRSVTIFTEWLDHDGRPLPDELGLDDGEQYGLTGRLAKVAVDGVLQGAAVGADSAQFSIPPGRKTQTINLNSNLTRAEHFYVHVIGKPREQECATATDSICPNFDGNPVDNPVLRGRPVLSTPFLTPLYDESVTLSQQLSANQLVGNNEAEPIYVWQYRPEYQFTQYDFDVSSIETRSLGEGIGTITDNLINEVIPTISTDDDFLDVFYSLINPEFNALASVDSPQELIFSVGEEEFLITPGENNTLSFEDISRLESLQPHEFLSLRLYSNNDAANILWEWAFFLDILIVDQFYNQVSDNHIASNPNPVIHMGKGLDLLPHTPQDVAVFNGIDGRLRIFGKVYCDLANVVPGGQANIQNVILRIPRTSELGEFEEVTVPLTNIADNEASDIRPINQQNNINSIEDEAHSFIGYFEHEVDFSLRNGSVDISVRAENVIGNFGFSTISIKTEQQGSRSFVVSDITNSDRNEVDRGIVEPFWIQVIDEEINPLNISERTVDFFGASHNLVQHENGGYYANKPFLFLTKALNIAENTQISNIRNVVASPEPVDVEYDNQIRPQRESATLGSTYSGSFLISNNEEFFSTVESYTPNSTVSLNILVDPSIDSLEDSDVSIYERKTISSVKGFFLSLSNNSEGDYQIDNDIQILNIVKGEIVNDKQLYQIVIELGENAHEFKNKRLRILSTNQENQSDDIFRADFKALPLKTVILAVDAMAYKTLKDVLETPEAANLNAIFGGGKALGLDKPALSALPTITWANWPGVFSGGPPSEHGWLGNSFFPRESTSGNRLTGNFKFPIFSSGDESALGIIESGVLVGLHPDKQQQLGVALGGADALGLALSATGALVGGRVAGFGGATIGATLLDNAVTSHAYSMDERSLDTAASIYDKISDELGLTAETPLIAESVKVFYERSNNSNVSLTSTFFSAVDPHGHSAAAANLLDNGEKTTSSDDDGILSILAKGSGPTARDIWAEKGEDLDIISIYLPGTDNAGHTFGNADLDYIASDAGDDGSNPGIPIEGNEFIDVINPPEVLFEHASTQLDAAVGKLLRQIEISGHLNTTLFAITGDHGQHTFRNTEQFLLLVNDIRPLIETSRLNGGMGMEMWDGNNYDDSQVVYSPNGAVGQFYLRAEGRTWQEPPNRVDVERLAALLYVESLGLRSPQLVCELRNRSGEPLNQCRQSVETRPLFSSEPYPTNESNIPFEVGPKTDGAYGAVPAIFVKLSEGQGNHFLTDYRWVKSVTPIPSTPDQVQKYSVELGAIDEFISASLNGPDQWPAFKERMDELNHKFAAGSRSGDIVTIMNGEQGHLTVNNSSERYAGWHGGPTRSESEVPLVFALTGNAFTNASGERELIPARFQAGYSDGVGAANLKDDGLLRNWHLSIMLQKILKAYRASE